MIRHLGWIIFCIAFVNLSSMVGCTCGDVTQGVCSKDDECTGRLCSGNRCACQENKCVPVQCLRKSHCETGFECKEYKCVGDNPTCKKDEDCPQGKKCNQQTGVCEDDKTTCGSNNDCTDPGKVCCDLGDGTGKRCNFPKCLKDEDCAPTASNNTCVTSKPTCNTGQKSACVKGVCQCKDTCGGDCGPNRCCDAKNEVCKDNPDPCPGVTCQPGYDPPDRSKYPPNPKTCEFDTTPVCDCVKKPPLDPGPNGLYSDLALLQGQPVVSGYNENYGDLVVGFQQADKSIKWEFVDGVPTSAKPSNDPDGPRGGISEKGDDVGLYTSIVADGQNIHVAYHDATNGSLKYARKEGGKWTLHEVDKNGKGIGRFTAIRMFNGAPVIAYYVLNNGKGQTELRVAQAKSPTPGSAGDWTLNTVETADLPGCKGTCDANNKEVCVEENKKPVCKADTGDCSPKCGSDEVCVNKQCQKAIPVDGNDPLEPRGVGLYPSLAVNGAKLYIAYYDQSKGDLKLARLESGQFVSSALKTTGDIGEFPSLAIAANGALHISYTDVDTGDIRYLRLSAALKIEVDELVDGGIRFGEDRQLNDSALALDPSGAPRIVYQDASVQALMIAVRTGDKQWNVQKIVGEDVNLGAFGFFNAQVLDGNTSYISNYKYLLKGSTDNSAIDIRTYP